MYSSYTPDQNIESSKNSYDENGCLEKSISACGPKICWVCPSPIYERNWTEEDRAKGVDQTRKNIYYGGVICDFKPRSDINDRFCNRMFLHTPSRPPYEYAGSTETEFYLRHGESSSCSPYWRFRYSQKPLFDTSDKYERVGPAPF